MLALAMLLPLPGSPIVPGATMAADTQWDAIAACPVVAAPGQTTGSGVVVGTRDGFVYVLTAAHVAKWAGLEIRFFARDNLAEPAWYADAPEAVHAWPDIDLALIRFKAGPAVAPLPLAPPGDRPKAFPFPAVSVGAAGGRFPTAEADAVRAKRMLRRDDGRVTFFWETDQPSRPGRSGGPLLDWRGRVLGVCSATQGGRGYFVHLDEIHAALKRDGFGWLIAPRP